jgi:peroxiredoxin/protocatechuate 3,4-dioxygenase beta subunit
MLTPAVWAADESDQGDDGDADHALVEGIAVNHFGAGVVDVKVTIWQGDKLLGEGVTGGTGEFAVPISKNVQGKITLKMSKPGFTEFEIEEDFDPEDPPYVDTELKGATQFRGKVVHHLKETPIVGANVKMESAGRTWEATTNEKGEFAVKEIVPGRLTMTVSAEGFGRELKSLEVGELAQKAIVALKPERAIRIHVVDDKGKDVAEATVHLQTIVEDQPDLQMKATDEKGVAEFRNVNYDIREAHAKLYHPDHVQDQGFLRQIEISKSSELMTGELVLVRAAKIIGVVTDANTGNPVHSARVIAGVPGEGFVPMFFTDAKGRYELTGIDGGTYPITLHRTDYAPNLTKVSVDRGEIKTVNLSMDKGRPLGGVVVDDSGQPLSEFYVISKNWLGFDTLGFKAITDEKGHFEFDNAPVGEISFQIQTPDLQQKSAEDALLRSGRTNYRIEVKSLVPLQPIPAAPVANIKPGDLAPHFKMTSLEGTELSLDKLRGNYVFLDFWATWCGPCVQELPNLQALHKATKGRNDFVIISISADESERTLKQFLSTHSIAWHQVFGQDNGVPEVSQAFDVEFLPSTFLIDKSGKVLDTNLRGESLVDRVLEFIAKEPAAQKQPGLK